MGWSGMIRNKRVEEEMDNMPGAGSRMGIRAWLLLLSLGSIIPVAAFAVTTILLLGQARQAGLTTELAQRAEAAAQAVDQRLATAVAVLETLARSEAARHGDLEALWAMARRVLPLLPDVSAFTVIDRDGRQLINTLRPFGEQLPPSGDAAAARRVIESGAALVSGPFTGSVTNAQIIAVGIPMPTLAGPTYCLRMVIQTAAVAKVLAAQRLPDEWVASVVDAKGVIIARTLDPDLHAGTKSSASLVEALDQGRAGVMDLTSKEGTPLTAALIPLPDWGVNMVIGVPTDILRAPLNRALWLVSLGGALALAVGAALALTVARRLAGQISTVAEATRAMAEGVASRLPAISVRELGHIGEAMDQVQAKSQEAHTALADAVVEREQIKAELTQARHDPLTALPGRALFLDMAGQVRRRCLDRTGLALAILFVDLDNFKQINDTLGHAMGDEALKRAADILRGAVRGDDVAGRLGGDEFVVCVAAPAGVIHETASRVAERIIAQITGIGHGLGCSIGILLAPDPGADIEDLLSRADSVMYQAKRQGKNRYVIQ